MIEIEAPPQYLHPAPSERGETFALAFSDYRALCSHCLGLLHSIPDSVMAIRRAGPTAACIDFWFDRTCLTIELSSVEKTLKLFVAADLDSPELPALYFEGTTSLADWHSLKECALSLSSQ